MKSIRLTNQRAVASCTPMPTKRVIDLSERLQQIVETKEKKIPSKDEFSLCLGIFTLLDGLPDSEFLLNGFSKTLGLKIQSYKHFRLVMSENTFWSTKDTLQIICKIIGFLLPYALSQNVHIRYIKVFENYLSEVVELPKDFY